MKKLLAALGIVVLLAGCNFKKDDSNTTADTATTPTLTAEVCNNGDDDDGDGTIDCADTDCAGYSSCTTTTSTTSTTGTASFVFSGVKATLENTKDGDMFYLRGFVGNKGKAKGTVSVGVRARVGNIAFISSDTITPKVPTLEPGLWSEFDYSVKTEGYPVITWYFWLKYAGSEKKEYTISYIPPVSPQP